MSCLNIRKKFRCFFDVFLISDEKLNLIKLEETLKDYKCKLTVKYIEGDLLKELPTTKIFKTPVYYRLMLPFLLGKEIEKILYLDVDIVVNGSLIDIWETNIDEVYLAAVPDIEVSQKCSLNRLKLSPKEKYFNSGVLLLNMNRIKKNKVFEKVMAYLKETKEEIIFPDQDGLNKIVSGEWKELESKWNGIELEEKNDNIIIIHYTNNKPWFKFTNHPYRNLYYYYLEKTSWKDFKPLFSNSIERNTKELFKLILKKIGLFNILRRILNKRS